MENPQAFIYACLAILAAVFFVRWYTNPLRRIPTVGGSDAPGLSLLAVFKFLKYGKQLIEEGYHRYPDSAFKVALIDQWLIIVSGSKMVDELRKRPDDEVSFIEGVEELLQTRCTLGREALDDPYHVGLIRENLTRALSLILPDVIDELSTAVPDHIPTEGDEWCSVTVLTAMQKIVARASNRVFVGPSVCRNDTYLDIAIDFTLALIKDKTVINMFPTFLKGLAGPWTSNAKRSVRRAVPFLKPLLDERRAKLKEHGENWPEKPNDMVQWVLEEAIPRQLSDESIAMRLLLVNFAAIHTSSNSMTHAIFDLVSSPEYIEPLREEIESAIKIDGWTKTALSKMWKLDSFLKESQRLNGIGLTSVTRKALKSITLNDGTFIPEGSLVVAATYPTHHDDMNYEDAQKFDPFRFSRMRGVEGESAKHQYVNTSVSYISFGHGKHACPGRFFAANELKSIFAYILVNYDMKLTGDGTRPANVYFASNLIPDPTGKVMFRKRQASA